MAINNYDPNTGRKLNPGETVTFNGQKVTQGSTFGAPGSYGSSSNEGVNTTDQYIAPAGMPGYAGNKRKVLNPNYKPTSSITPDDVKDPPITFPGVENVNMDYNSILGNATGQVSAADIARLGAEGIDKQATDTKKLMEDLFSAQKTPETLLAEARSQSGRDDAQRILSEETAKLKGIIANGEALKLSVIGQGRGIPEAIIGGQQAQIGRETAITALPVMAAVEVAQGNFQAANELMGQLFTAKSQFETNKLNYGLKVIDVISTAASKKEELQLGLVKDKLKAQEERAQKNIDAVNQISIKIAENGKSTSSINTALSKINFSSPDAVNQALKIAGNSLMTPSQEVIKLDNGNVVIWDKNLNKIIKTISGGDGGGGVGGTGNAKNFNSIISLTAALEGTVAGKKTVTSDMTRYLNNQDYKSAYNQIENTVMNGLTGTSKTTFTDSRNDAEVLRGLRTKIQDYKDAGGDMGLLKGTAERITRKLGSVKDPALASLAVALQREFQTYRVNMTGAAFGKGESADYASVNPKTTSSFNLNMAVIDGAISQLDNRVNSTVDRTISGASEIRNLANRTTSNLNAKQEVNSLYKNANTQVKTIIEGLFNKNYSDADVLEYLKIKGLK